MIRGALALGLTLGDFWDLTPRALTQLLQAAPGERRTKSERKPAGEYRNLKDGKIYKRVGRIPR